MNIQQLVENGQAKLPPPVENVPTSSLDLYASDVLEDPYPHYETLREAGPVVWLERYGAYAVSHYEPVRAILNDHETYCSSAGAGLSNFHTSEPWRKPSILLEVDPPYHNRTRQQMMRVLTPGGIRALRPVFEAQAKTMVQRLIDMGTCDGVTDLAEAYPLKVFGDAVGIPADGREHLLPYGDMVFNGFGPANERFHACFAQVKDAAEWIAHACSRDVLTRDGFGAQLYSAVDRDELTYEEAELLVRSLLSAGLDTTVFTLGNAIVNLARAQDQWKLLQQKPALARQAVEEILRYDGTFHSFYRTTSRETDLCGIALGKSQKICVLTASANRDPRHWDRPDAFDISRRASNHLAFGTGIHGCAGQMIARLEGEIVLNTLATMVDRLEMIGDPVLHFNNTVRGYKSIPLRIVGKS